MYALANVPAVPGSARCRAATPLLSLALAARLGPWSSFGYHPVRRMDADRSWPTLVVVEGVRVSFGRLLPGSRPPGRASLSGGRSGVWSEIDTVGAIARGAGSETEVLAVAELPQIAVLETIVRVACERACCARRVTAQAER